MTTAQQSLADIAAPAAAAPERKWMPHDYQDESVPPARANPSDWIMKTDSGHALAWPADGFGPDEAAGTLHNGDIVLFDWTEEYGHRTVVFERETEDVLDGLKDRWTMTGDAPTASPDASLCVAEVGNWETMAPSLEEFCAGYGEFGSEGEVLVTFYGWSQSPVPFEFRDGAFHQVGQA